MRPKEKSINIQDIFSLYDFINLKIAIHIKREVSAVNDVFEEKHEDACFINKSALISDKYEVKQILVQAKSNTASKWRKERKKILKDKNECFN